MTINALVASDTVLIPVQAAYLPVKGLQQLIRTISMVKNEIEPEANDTWNSFDNGGFPY